MNKVQSKYDEANFLNKGNENNSRHYLQLRAIHITFQLVKYE